MASLTRFPFGRGRYARRRHQSTFAVPDVALFAPCAVMEQALTSPATTLKYHGWYAGLMGRNATPLWRKVWLASFSTTESLAVANLNGISTCVACFAPVESRTAALVLARRMPPSPPAGPVIVIVGAVSSIVGRFAPAVPVASIVKFVVFALMTTTPSDPKVLPCTKVLPRWNPEDSSLVRSRQSGRMRHVISKSMKPSSPQLPPEVSVTVTRGLLAVVYQRIPPSV